MVISIEKLDFQMETTIIIKCL